MWLLEFSQKNCFNIIFLLLHTLLCILFKIKSHLLTLNDHHKSNLKQNIPRLGINIHANGVRRQIYGMPKRKFKGESDIMP